MQRDVAHVLFQFQRLGTARRKLLIEAAFRVAGISVGLKLLPFKLMIRRGMAPLHPRPASGKTVADCVWAVATAARWSPLRAKCIEQGISLQAMLRRRGVDARLHYGARQGVGNKLLEAHVWVSVAGEIVIGAEEASRFALLATYPEAEVKN